MITFTCDHCGVSTEYANTRQAPMGELCSSCIDELNRRIDQHMEDCRQREILIHEHFRKEAKPKKDKAK